MLLKFPQRNAPFMEHFFLSSLLSKYIAILFDLVLVKMEVYMRDKNVFQTIQNEKNNLKDIFLISIILALGVNILVSGIIGLLHFDHKDIILVILGVSLVFLAMFVFYYSNLKKLKKQIKYNGFFILRKNPKMIVSVDEYGISKDMNQYLKAIFAENKAVQRIWESDNTLSDPPSKRNHANTPANVTSDISILHELIEYCVLDSLSMNLSSYFDNSGLNKIETHERADVADILLSNRFLKQFSEDMINRDIFSDFPITDKHADEPKTKSKVVRAYLASGAIYSRFEITLPKDSKVTRLDDKIIISTRMFTIEISIKIPGFISLLPSLFERSYLGLNKISDFESYEFYVELSFKFKKRFVFSATNWSYYKWAMIYIDNLDEYLSKEHFFKKINWNTIRTLLICNNTCSTKKASNPEERTEDNASMSTSITL